MPTLHELVALSLLPIPRLRTVVSQLAAGLPPAAILEQHCDDRRRRHPNAEGAERLRARAAAAISRGHAAGLRALRRDDREYPPALLTTIDPPLVLWVRGDVEALHRPSVAIVGARTGSPYALMVAERLAADLADAGLAIVSGLARGVDAAAHRGALSVDGVTVAVLGSGTDVVYPHEHRDLASQVAARGAVISELAPGTPPCAPFFPQRNRIISGLSRAVLVVEAGEKSGSLITARCALEQGRDVLAVPGNVLSGRNRGGHALIRDGARIVESADDVLDEIGLAAVRSGERAGGDRSVCTDLRGEPDAVLGVLPPAEPCDLDRISALSGLSAAPLLTRLLELEMKGQVRRLAGGQFVRIDRSC